MRIENIFPETIMSEEQKGEQDHNEGLSQDKQLRFHTLLAYAGELEKEINGLIADFEQKHRASCWVSTENHNRVSIAIAADTDQL